MQELPRSVSPGEEIISIEIGLLRFDFTAACLVAAGLLQPSAHVFAETNPAASPPAAAPVPNAAMAPASEPQPASAVERGKYLTDAGNCISCHTQTGAVAFSGGVPFETPFGTIYSSNITPDPATGIGAWTADDLRRAMHEGIAAGGYRLFPAFPYTSFTKVTDADVDAIYQYLRTVKAARYTPPSNDFAFTQRWGMMFWNSMFFSEGRFSPDAARSAEWNRGAYLVEGLGHCGACHTPRNLFMAETSGKAYAGGTIRDKVAQGKIRRWSAVNLTPAKNGLAAWSVNDLAKYLQTGFSPRAGTLGP